MFDPNDTKPSDSGQDKQNNPAPPAQEASESYYAGYTDETAYENGYYKGYDNDAVYENDAYSDYTAAESAVRTDTDDATAQEVPSDTDHTEAPAQENPFYSGYSEAPAQENPFYSGYSEAPAPEATEKKTGFFGRIKTRFSGMLSSMKQVPEAEDDLDALPSDYSAPAAALSEYAPPQETAPVTETAPAEVPAPKKRGFFSRFALDSYEDEEVEESAPVTESAPIESAPPQESAPTETAPVTETAPAADGKDDSVQQTGEKPHYYPWSKEEAPSYVPWSRAVRKNDSSQSEEKTAQSDDKPAAVRTEQPKADGANEPSDGADQSNVIYKAPERKAQTAPVNEPKKQQPVKETAPEKPAVHRRELPAFDIFAEFAKEQEQKKTVESPAEQEAPAEKQDTPVKQEAPVNSETAPATQEAPVKQESPAEPEVSAVKSEIPEKTETPVIPERPVNTVKDNSFTEMTVPMMYKPSARGVGSESFTLPRIPDDGKQAEAVAAVPVSSLPADADMPSRVPENVIYDSQPLDGEEPGRDLTEGKPAAVSYHYSNNPPFIVMAGKFTRTLRTEYEAARAFREAELAAQRAAEQERAASEQQAHEKKHFPSFRSDKKQQPAAPAAQRSAERPKRKTQAPAIAPAQQKKPAQPAVAKKPAQKKKPAQPAVAEKPAQKKKPAQPAVAEKPAQQKQLIDILLAPEPQQPAPAPEKPKEDKQKRLKSRAEKHSAAKSKKDKNRFRFRELFSGEEDYDPDDIPVTETVQKPQLDDYTEESDADAIKTEINSNFQTVFARTVTLLTVTVASVILSLIAQCSGLFTETIRNGWLWYAVINFILFAIAVIASRGPIVNGLQPLRRFRGNSDTAVAVASAAAAMQSIIALFTPYSFINGEMFIYAPLVILALFCNSAGKLLIITRAHDNFAFLIKPYPKYAGKIFTDKTNADKMVRGMSVLKPIIGYTRRARFLTNFLQLSYAPDPSEQLAAKIAPWTTAFSAVCGLLYGLISQSFIGSISSFALTACMSVPVISLLAVNIPLRRLCRHSLKNGAMITSYETVKQFCDTNAVMIDSSQLYPKGSVTLSGMKSFKQTMLNDALLAGAAIMHAVNGTLIHVFDNIVQVSKNMLPRVDNVIYEDGRGLEGWVRGQRVLIGNRELLKAHNIEPPEKEVEERHYRLGKEIAYITVGGELIAMFILSYKTTKHVANELRTLEENGVSFIVRTVDANLTREFIAEHFGLFHRCINVVPTSLGNICSEAMSGTDERSRAYLMTRGKLSSFARAVSGCIKIKTNVTISKILQMIALGLGLGIITLISFASGFEKLGCLEMLIYTAFWSLTSIIASMIKK